MKIYKYNLLGLKELPEGYTILHIGTQHHIPTIWCAVDPDAPMAPTGLVILPTGAIVPEDLTPVASFLMSDDSLVWHVFRESA